MANKIQHTSATTREFTLELLKQITDNFSEEHVIGRGGYGVVYKGLLHDGEEIALKKLHYIPGLDDKQFMNEFNNLMRAQHPNIIRLVGYCSGGHERFKHNGEYIFARVQERILCFEYLQGGSLDKHISDESCGLDWNTRFKIIKGVSKGINYLHNGCKDPIYHLDLKPENILLDKNLVPKIGDFGLSRLFQTKKTHITSTFMGTMGYMPPEYIKRLAITPKFDVFSFGVIIIRIVAGYEGYSKCEHMSPREFLEHVRKMFCIMNNNPLSTKIILLRLTFHATFRHCIQPVQVHGNWGKRMQETLSSHISEQVMACIKIAFRCVELDREKRPTMADIVNELDKIDNAESSAIGKNSDEQEHTLEKQPEIQKQETYDSRYHAPESIVAQLFHSLSNLLSCEYVLQANLRKDIKHLKRELDSVHFCLARSTSPQEFLEHVHEIWGKWMQVTMSLHTSKQVITCIKKALRRVEFNQEKRPTIVDLIDELNKMDNAERSAIGNEFIEHVHGKWGKRLQEIMSEQVTTCIEIAFRYGEFDREKRPTIVDIVDELNKIDNAESSAIGKNSEEQEHTLEKQSEIQEQEKYSTKEGSRYVSRNIIFSRDVLDRCFTKFVQCRATLSVFATVSGSDWPVLAKSVVAELPQGQLSVKELCDMVDSGDSFLLRSTFPKLQRPRKDSYLMRLPRTSPKLPSQIKQPLRKNSTSPKLPSQIKQPLRKNSSEKKKGKGRKKSAR